LEDYPNFVHVSFLSTGPTNIVGVNALPYVTTYTREKSRGRGEFKRVWKIEMNEARDMYLDRYGVLDRCDGRLSRLNLKLLSMRYHLGATMNGFGMACVDAFNIYRDLADGDYGDEYRIPAEQQRSQKDWMMAASIEGLKYKTSDCLYPGDEDTRTVKQSAKKKRKTTAAVLSGGSAAAVQSGGTTADGRRGQGWRRGANFKSNQKTKKKVEETKRDTEQKRRNALSSNVSEMTIHTSVCDTQWHVRCHFCGENTYKSCAECKVPLCSGTRKKSKTLSQRTQCHLHYHNPRLFGLARADLSPTERKVYKYPTKEINSVLKDQLKEQKKRTKSAGKKQ